MFLSLIYQNKTKHMTQTIIIKETNHSAGNPISFSGNEFVLFADRLDIGNHTTSLFVSDKGIRQRGSDKVIVPFNQSEVRVNSNQFNRLMILAEKYNATNVAYFTDDSFDEA